MRSAHSLRSRLLVLIITPLILIAAASTWARYEMAKSTSQQLYDDTLLAVATTISRDITLSQGDLLAEDLFELLAESLGDQFFYHMTGPDLPFVTGYSDPPKIPTEPDGGSAPSFFDATYRGQNVRVVVMREFMDEETFGGWATITVWQTTKQRERLSIQIAQRAAAFLSILIIAGGFVVWFGVNLGLRPLSDLREAVTLRSPNDLKPIARPIPREVTELVGALNGLFERLGTAFAARDVFIANAAHQLRNPIAGLLAQTQAAANTGDEKERKSRLDGAVEAARCAARLTTQLLSIERLRADPAAIKTREFDLAKIAEEIASEYASLLVPSGVDIAFRVKGENRPIRGDQLLIAEALKNILDNAMKYGCRNGGEVEVSLVFGPRNVTVSVADDGPGVPSLEKESIFERFHRAKENLAYGTGLGLSIVREIAERHGGTVRLADAEIGAVFEMTLPYGGA